MRMFIKLSKSQLPKVVTEENICPSKDETFNKINSEEDIAALQLLISKASENKLLG